MGNVQHHGGPLCCMSLHLGLSTVVLFTTKNLLQICGFFSGVNTVLIENVYHLSFYYSGRREA